MAEQYERENREEMRAIYEAMKGQRYQSIDSRTHS